MAFKTTNHSTKGEWKKISVPDSKVVGIFVNKDSGKTSFMFEIADSSASNAVFFASATCVRRNKDRTGYIVSIPEGEVNVTESYKDNEGNWKRKSLVAESVAELGYPFED